jgi:hypothetical protein
MVAMLIESLCPTCQGRFPVDDRLAGKPVACPYCGLQGIAQAVPIAAEVIHERPATASVPRRRSTRTTLVICGAVICACAVLWAVAPMLIRSVRQPQNGVVERIPSIPGLSETDIHNPLVRRRFALTGPRRNADGTIDWTCIKNQSLDHSVHVEVSGYSPTKIHFVRVSSFDTSEPTQEALWVFDHVAGLEFQGADPAAARAWIAANFGKRASTSFGSVNFELFAHQSEHPGGENLRMLIVTTEELPKK